VKANEDCASGAALFEPTCDEARLTARFFGADLDRALSGIGVGPYLFSASDQEYSGHYQEKCKI
jgi:hypothetical protein